MKKEEFFASSFPENIHPGDGDYGPEPMNDYYVKYLLIRNASWELMNIVQTQHLKQIAESLTPFAYACSHASLKGREDVYCFPDLTTADGVKSFFDDKVCKTIADFVRKEAY